MKLLFCKAMILATWHAGPLACHPEVIQKGILRVDANGKLNLSGIFVMCGLGGPYRRGHGIWFCTKTAAVAIKNVK